MHRKPIVTKLIESEESSSRDVQQGDEFEYLQEGEYNVETILDVKVEFGRKFYLIKWQGYSHEQNTWEPIENLSKVIGFVEKFEEDYAKGKRLTMMEEENRVYFHKEEHEDEFSLGKKMKEPRRRNHNNEARMFEERPVGQGKSLDLEEDYAIQETNAVKEEHPKKKARIKKAWKPLKKARASDEEEDSDSDFEVPAKRRRPHKDDSEAQDESLLHRVHEKRSLRVAAAGNKKSQSKSRKVAAAAPTNKEMVGSFRNGDRPCRILSTSLGRGGGFDFIVEWERRYDGSRPENSMVTNEELKKHDPYFLVDFYEAKIEVINKHRAKKTKEKAEEGSVIVIPETPTLMPAKEKEDFDEKVCQEEIEQPPSEATKLMEVVAQHAAELENLTETPAKGNVEITDNGGDDMTRDSYSK